MAPKQNSEDGGFGDIVNDIETQDARTDRRINLSNIWFRGGFVAALLGGIWTVGTIYHAFQDGLRANHDESVALRNDLTAEAKARNTDREIFNKELTDARSNLEKLRAHTLALKELDFWSEALQQKSANAGVKLEVPKPSDYKVDY